MSNPLQNHKCNILPGIVSHVNKFDEIKGSNLTGFSLIYVSAKLDWFTWFTDMKLMGITEYHKQSIMFDKQSSTS